MGRWFVAMCVAFLATFPATVQADRQEDVISYLSNLTNTLQKAHLGVFNCWLLEFYINSTHSSILNSLAHQLHAQHTSLLQANHRAKLVPTIREPNMVIIVWGREEQIAGSMTIHQWVANIPSECPTVVLFVRRSGLVQPWLVGTYLAERMVFHFALIAIDDDAMYTFHYEPMRITTHTGFPAFSELFFDRTKTMQRKLLTAAYFKDYYTSKFCDHLNGEDMALFVLFAEVQQFAVNLLEIQCRTNESYGRCIARYNGTNFIVNRFVVNKYNKYTVSCTAMRQMAIATPKERLLTIWEMLLKPFELSGWAIIFAVLLTCQLFQLCSPTLFANNVLALALFGFEKRKLRLTKHAEKVTASALIVFFFQLKCAYEAKLVSYLTETPRLPDAMTLEDLRDRNITVYYKNDDITYVNVLLAGMVTAPYERETFLFDGITLLENRQLLEAEKMFVDNIEGYGMLYTILPANAYENLPFYVFGEKSVFCKRFQKHQQRMFESGMQLHWRQEHLNCFLLHIVSAHHKRGAYKHPYVAIRFEHLKPLMLFFIVQWTFEIVVFVMELIAGRYSRK
ncbi:uncharacterized protein LOC128299347 [Anopheles moucheti]|uniref:uncharacterized protein LOC128299347 n=1 Tax=Anopheles moucheti TaxID=186751 RepID=UPI0022F10E31|nr:uncharacterized protein LOC128299347 [Anopheles moucheti]